jgi:hypothetical protein
VKREGLRCQLHVQHPASLHAAMVVGNQIVFWGARSEGPTQPLYQLPWAPAFPQIEEAS